MEVNVTFDSMHSTAAWEDPALGFWTRLDPSNSSRTELPSITTGARPLMETSERRTATSVFVTETPAPVEVPMIVKTSLKSVSSVPLQESATFLTTSTGP
jgi:hypothetical protein